MRKLTLDREKNQAYITVFEVDVEKEIENTILDSSLDVSNNTIDIRLDREKLIKIKLSKEDMELLAHYIPGTSIKMKYEDNKLYMYICEDHLL